MSHGISNRKNSLSVDKTKLFDAKRMTTIGARGFSGTAVTAGC